MLGKNIKKIHIIGIEGAGTSALACMLVQSGVSVSGSDEGDHFYFDVLKANDIKVNHAFSADNIPSDANLVIHSTAFKPETNIELQEAVKRKIKLMPYPEALGYLIRQKYGIAVCGSHGKTTTTAWLAYVMKESGLDPSAIIGSKVKQFNSGSLVGGSQYMIVEVDEYQNKLSYYEPKVILLNNIEYEHPDFFATEADYIGVFIDFIGKIPKSGFLIANFDDQNVVKISRVNCIAKVITYSLVSEEVNYRAYDLEMKNGKHYFKVRFIDYDSKNEEYLSDQSDDLGEFAISLPGRHNVYNALAVIAASIELGIELRDLRTHLDDFIGTARRLDQAGEYHGALIINDYAHHPTEIKAILATIKELYPQKNIKVVFQPHTYTRTKQLLDDFASSFENADELIVLDIYGSAREKQGGVHSRDLIAKIKIIDPLKQVEYIPTVNACADYLKEQVSSGDVLVLLGAGEAYQIGDKLIGG